MAIYGETINQTLPTVAITGATTGSFTINPSIDTEGNSGTVGVVDVDTGRVVRHNYSKSDGYPVITGTATITITAHRGTQVHYTLNGRNPTSKASKADSSDATAINARTNHSRDGHARVYASAFTIENSRPGSNLCTLRIRAYKTADQTINGTIVSGISPNEKSQVLIVKFVLNHHSW